MGFGDSIMVASIAKRIHAMTNQRVVPVDAKWEPYWDALWDGLSYMQRSLSFGGITPLRNAPHAERPYYSGVEGNRILWRKWDIAPGEIRLTEEERAWAARAMPRPRIVLGWDFKELGGGGANKNWGAESWAQVSVAFPRGTFVQLRAPEAMLLAACEFAIETPTFRHACAILERSLGYVGHEGGLHHAAAALGKPAVVVFGGYISPEVTGYDTHTNLYVPDEHYPLGCGTVTPCEHCRESMSKITVEQVVNATKAMIQ